MGFWASIHYTESGLTTNSTLVRTGFEGFGGYLSNKLCPKGSKDLITRYLGFGL